MERPTLNVGEKITEMVSRIRDFGVFLEDRENLILVLVTNMKTNGIVEHPSMEVATGDQIEVEILRYNDAEQTYAAKCVH